MHEEIEVVKALELELLQPETRKSLERLSELLADDFFEFMQSGAAATKQDILDYLPNAPEEQFVVRDMEVKILSAENILLHYIADRKVIESGEEKCTLCSSIWQKRDGRWQMLFFQGTPAKK